MGARNPTRREQTAATIAQAAGVSERTVRRHQALPWDQVQREARSRRQAILVMREKDIPYRDIASYLGITVRAAQQEAYRARKASQAAAS